jgi:hypothetical protein
MIQITKLLRSFATTATGIVPVSNQVKIGCGVKENAESFDRDRLLFDEGGEEVNEYVIRW